MPLRVIAIPDPIHAAGIDRLKASFDVRVGSLNDREGQRRMIREADAVVIRNLKLDADLLHASPRLKLIAKHGVGVDNIDIDTATGLGIPVTNIPGGNAAAVAEGTVALMLAVLRRTPDVHRRMAAGETGLRWNLRFGQLTGRTLGLVGCGDIGSRVAAICAGGFSMRVLGYDPGRSASDLNRRGIEKVNRLELLLAEADVVSLHVPLTPETHHMIGARQLADMKQSAVLVNAARGALIDETALHEALLDGRIAGAALDVFEVEPPDASHPLLSLPNMVATPHTSGSTDDADQLLAVGCADIVAAVFADRRPATLINPEVWSRRRPTDEPGSPAQTTSAA